MNVLVKTAGRDLKRLKEILSVLFQYGLGPELEKIPALRHFLPQGLRVEASQMNTLPFPKRLRKIAEELGTTAVKFAQILALRNDLLPKEITDELMLLQDRAPTLPFDVIKGVIEDSFSLRLEELFDSFEVEPLGAASISQVHRAKTKDLLEDVVVKVQRPGIEEKIRGDLDILYFLAKILENSIEELAILAPSELVLEFEKSIVKELNFSLEASHLTMASKLFEGHDFLKAPKLYAHLSTRHVLTMEYFKGVPIRNLPPEGEKTKEIVERLVSQCAELLFVHGWFHADPHGGNILVNSEGEVAMIDLGIVGSLSAGERIEILNLLFAISVKDSASISRILMRMGQPLEKVSFEKLRKEIDRILNTYFKESVLSEVPSKEFAQDFMGCAQNFRIKLAPDFMLLTKALVTFEGVARSLHPELDVKVVLKDLFQRILTDRMNPFHFAQEGIYQLIGTMGFLKDFPLQIEQILRDTQSGFLTIKVDTPDLKELPKFLNQVAITLSLSLFAVLTSLGGGVVIRDVYLGADKNLLFLGIPLALTGSFTWIYIVLSHLMARAKTIKIKKWTQFSSHLRQGPPS